MTDPTVTMGMESGDRRTHVERLNPTAPRAGADQPAQGPTMTPEQFEELKALLRELLTPGYELSKMFLERAKAEEAERQRYVEGQRARDEAEGAFKAKPTAEADAAGKENRAIAEAHGIDLETLPAVPAAPTADEIAQQKDPGLPAPEGQAAS